MKKQDEVAAHVSAILHTVEIFLEIEDIVDDVLFVQPELSPEIITLFQSSSLFLVLESYLRSNSLLDMVRFSDLYKQILRFVRVVSTHDNLLNLIVKEGECVYSLLSIVASTSLVTLKRVEKSDESTRDSLVNTDEFKLAAIFSETLDFLDNRLKREQIVFDIEKEEKDKKDYINIMQQYQFDNHDMQVNGNYIHHYSSDIRKDLSPSRTKFMRLVREIGTLSTGLPLYPDSSIFLRVDEERMDTMRCIITGPVDTPYAYGAFQFDIYCPPSYPKKNPKVNLQTTGNGAVRFNPNLYACGKVCLSLLGTWRGGPNEEWNDNSTLLQVLVSIQSLILVEEPFFNEPGYESMIGSPEGDRETFSYNENIRVSTIRWAIINQIKNPTPGFEETILTHFKLQRQNVMSKVEEWMDDTKREKFNLSYYNERYDEIGRELYQVLFDLDPEVPLISRYAENEIKPQETLQPIPQETTVPPLVEYVQSEYSLSESSSELLSPTERWALAIEVESLVPGFVLGLYYKALELNDDSMELSIEWIFSNPNYAENNASELETISNNFIQKEL
eukprot:TRINITY_DN8235_c0_g1_i1.p1 TRINITY_DN8235_c0_g1~~TRINITY_DN8235_c0_g1_i1.p1  ORF type:complete len:623 (+),score=138.71 TRINITY_DN8235_c0_g1_i1:192-1871(+)